MGYMALGDPLIKPFVQEADLNGLKEDAALTLSAGAGYTVAVKDTTAVDGNGTAITASSRPGYVAAKVDVLTDLVQQPQLVKKKSVNRKKAVKANKEL